MIIEIPEDRKIEIVKKLSWKGKFKKYLRTKNNTTLDQILPKQTNSTLKNNTIKSLKKLFLNENVIYSYDNLVASKSHSFYSAYVPLRSHYRLGDQFMENFPYLRFLQENCLTEKKGEYYNEIYKEIKEGKESNTDNEKEGVMKKWSKCCQMFLPQIDVIQAIEMYLELLKSGTTKLNQFYRQYGGLCKKQIFFHRIWQSSKYFKEQPRLRKGLNLSIETNEQINQISMSKTAKNLFCSICLLYDCGFHKIDDKVLEKGFQYVSARNVKSKEEHVRKAIKICQQYDKIRQGRHSQLQSCSEDCYKILNLQTLKKAQFQRVKLLSPIIKGLIKIGIYIFSYEPCMICKLLPQIKPNKISCSLVLIYLLEQYNIKKRIYRKFYESEYQMLLNQRIYEQISFPKPQPVVVKKGNQKKNSQKKINHYLGKVKEDNIQIATCFHNFIGEQPTDINCQQCSCHKRGFCLPQCVCFPSCPLIIKGCTCKGKDDCKSRRCNCFLNKHECQPGICLNCFQCESIQKKNNCYNDQVLRGKTKLLRIGPSKIPQAGLGAFAGQAIEQESLVTVYGGQVIEPDIEVFRQLLCRDQTFYTFGSPNGTIDSRYMGNKSRFINHGEQANANIRSYVVFSRGYENVVFYAERNIEKGEELYFDYDGEGHIAKNFHEKYPFIKQRM